MDTPPGTEAPSSTDEQPGMEVLSDAEALSDAVSPPAAAGRASSKSPSGMGAGPLPASWGKAGPLSS
ncbi:hypothetical protein [Streptomyces spinosirectus]